MISRYILAAFLWVFVGAPAQAQQTKAALTAEINTNWPDNVTGAITPAILRSTVIDIVNSYYDLNGGSSLACAAHQWVAGLPTLSSITCSQPAFTDISGQVTLVQLPTIGANTALCSIPGGTPTACSKTQLTTLINLATASLSGALPAWPNNTTTYFRGDGTYQTLNVAAIGGFGTGIAAALGQAIGTAGAPVLFNGTLGTPSSGTVGTGVTLGGVTVVLGSDATGDVYCRNSSGILTRIPIGGAATVLTSGGAGACPAWVSPAGGGNVSNTGTPVAGQFAQWTNATTIQGVNLVSPAQGRITLTANTPVMIATASAQTTLRYDCYVGNQVPYYNGTIDQFDTISSCEVTDAMVSAASAGQVVSNNVYDVWWVHGGANRICLAMSSSTGGGGGWSSDTGGSNTSRGTGYSQIDRVTRPYVTNKNSIANCFNGASNYGPVSANQGTYLGTVFASGNGQISWTLGASASGGTAGLLGVWNMYNRIGISTTVVDSGTSYTYSTATPRQARASAGNQIQYLLGLQEDSVQFGYTGSITLAGVASSNASMGVGIDSTSAFTSAQIFQSAAAAAVNGSLSIQGSVSNLGVHTITAMENGDGTHSNAFDVTTSGISNASLMATVRY